MVFLKTDTGEYRELLVPSIISVGRSTANSVRPESQSVSKVHAQITLNQIPHTGKVEAWLEDLGSSNGTYAGESPLDIERVRGKIKLYFGFYVRFGHSPNYFQYLESIPVDAEVMRPEIVVPPSKQFHQEVVEYSNKMQQQQPQQPYQQRDPGMSVDYSTDRDHSTHNSQHRLYDQTNHSQPQPYSPHNDNYTQYGNPVDVTAPSGASNYGALGSSRGFQEQAYEEEDRRGTNPVNIFINSSGESGGGGSRTGRRSHGDSGRPRSTGGMVSPVQEGHREYSPSYSPAGAGMGMGMAASRSDEHANMFQTRNGPQGTDRVEFAESGNHYNNTGRLELDFHPAASSGAGDRYNTYSRPTEPRAMGQTGPSSKPKPVSQAISELNKLSRQSTSLRSSRVGKGTGPDTEGALHSRYYQDRLSKPKGILRASKNVEFQARLGDNGAIMDAVNPSKVELVRRSWPDELRLPSCDLISKFVDLILAQEAGTSQREFALYKDIYLGKFLPGAGKEGDAVPGLENEPVLSKLRTNPVKCDLPVVLPDTVMSEAVAESILETHQTAAGQLGACIKELNDLMRQCLLGSRIDTSLGLDTSADFDFALQGVIADMLRSCTAQLMGAQSSNVVRALEEGDVRSNAGLLIQQSIDSLSRAKAFLLGSYLQDEAVGMRTEQIYEIVALCLSAVLNKLDACNIAVWSIGQRADQVTMEHVVNKSGGFLKASLSLELEEMRKLKKESDLIPLVDRIRQQETNILERKLLRFHKVFEILLAFNMKTAFSQWRANARCLKRFELNLLDLQDRCQVNAKRSFFKLWRRRYVETHAFKKALRRFGRILAHKGEFQMRRFWKRWEALMTSSRHSTQSGAEIAKLRNQLCNLKATLHDLTNQDEVAASLAAERAMSRELSSMNLELRHSLQQLEEKLLETGAAPAGKRKDLVYHYLIGKEEELAEARREGKFLHSELDHLRILSARRVQPQPQRGKLSTVTPAGPPAVPAPRSAYRGGGGGQSAPRTQPAGRYDPARYKSVVDKPDDVAFLMSKDEAKVVILSEVRRLRDSHAALTESRNHLNNKMIEETSRNVQLTMGVQSLQGRLTAMERSANALRELLRQKFGDTGLVGMIEALESLGAGSNCLLEVAASSPTTVTDNGQYESKQDSGLTTAGGRGVVMGGSGVGSGGVNFARDEALAKMGAGNSGAKYGQGEEVSSHAYSRAIDDALYK